MTYKMQEIVLDQYGTARFKENVLVSELLSNMGPSRLPIEPWMLDQFKQLLDPKEGNAVVRWLAMPENRRQKSLNDIPIMDFPSEDREQLAMLIGYSVYGAFDLSYFSDETAARAEVQLMEMSKIVLPVSK